MPFTTKTWTDRMSEYPTRRVLTKEDNTTEIVTVARQEGTVSQEGDAFSAANMNDLETRIGAGFTEVNNNLNIKYNPDTDIVQIFYNNVWNDWKYAGLQALNALIPTMASATSPSGLVEWSSIFPEGGHYGYLIFDGKTTTFWNSGQGVKDAYVTYEFPEPVIPKTIDINCSKTGDTFLPTSSTVYVYSKLDIADYELIGTFKTTGRTYDMLQLPLTQKLCKTIKIRVVGDNGSYVALSKVQVYGR